MLFICFFFNIYKIKKETNKQLIKYDAYLYTSVYIQSVILFDARATKFNFGRGGGASVAGEEVEGKTTAEFTRRRHLSIRHTHAHTPECNYYLNESYVLI